jgi:hypothetical protein
MDALDLTGGVTGTYTPQKVVVKYIRSMVIARPNVHFLDPEILERVDALDPDDLVIIPLRCLNRRGEYVGSVTVSEP